jgi:hypothetical protein
MLYCPGFANGKPDALSRNLEYHSECEEVAFKKTKINQATKSSHLTN